MSEIPAEDRPAKIDWYIGRPILSHGWADEDQRYLQKTVQPTQIDALASQHRLVLWLPIFGHGCTKIRNTGRGQAGQRRSIQWPAVSDHGRTKIRNTGKRPAGQHKSIHWPQIFGHCSIKIRNTGKRPAGQHKSIHWPKDLGPLLDQAQEHWPTIAGMDWYRTNIDPTLRADWVAVSRALFAGPGSADNAALDLSACK